MTRVKTTNKDDVAAVANDDLSGDRSTDQWALWLDYLEGDWPPELKREIEKLLALSPADRLKCARLIQLREMIHEADEARVPEDDRRAEHLHNRIMARIDRGFEEESVAPPISASSLPAAVSRTAIDEATD